MFTVILITAFSTLGATALISLLFFLHYNIKTRVKKSDFRQEIDDVRSIIDDIYDRLYEQHAKDLARVNLNMDEQYRMQMNEINQLHSRIDSIHDQLSSKRFINSPAEPAEPSIHKN